MIEPLTLLTRAAFVACACAVGLTFANPSGSGWMPVAHADDDDDDGGGDDDDDGGGYYDDDYVVRSSPARSKRRRPSTPPRREEIVAVGVDDAALQRLQRQGFAVSARTQSQALGQPVTRMLAPSGRTVRASLNAVKREAPAAIASRNDLYQRHNFSRYRTEGAACGIDCTAFAMTEWVPQAATCSSRVTLGMIDTGVDSGHPSLKGAKIVTTSVRRGDRAAADPSHGTAVASLLLGRPDSPVQGVVPDARLLAADAFHRSGAGDSADAFDLLAAMDWLAGQGATVINMSLSGPDNDVLEAGVQALIAKNISIVAAAGKASGNATGYPARFPGVVAVSAIDGRYRALRSSNRGKHIMFTAPGAKIPVAGSAGGVTLVDGTSFASPFVAAAIALHASGGQPPARALDQVRSTVRDLGAKGHDPIFGWGLIQFRSVPTC